nr:ATP-binding protein [Dietzia natronolimnaea]
MTTGCAACSWSCSPPYGTGSIVFWTQYTKKDWHQRLGVGVHADAILDRIDYNSLWIDVGTHNMREHPAASH